MIQLLVILVCLVAVIVEYFFILWGWIVLALPIAFLLITLLSLKQKKWPYIPELSEAANQMFQSSAITIQNHLRVGILVLLLLQ